MDSEVTTALLPNRWAPKPDVIAKLAAFIDNLRERRWPNNCWLDDERMEVYVRNSRRRLLYLGEFLTFECLDIANCTVYEPGNGIFTQFLHAAKIMNPWTAVYIENVLTDRFANFFRKHAWIECPGEGAPCFYLPRVTPLEVTYRKHGGIYHEPADGRTDHSRI